MYKNILVPVDLNEDGFSDKALSEALTILEPGGQISIIKVLAGFQMPMVGSFFPKDAFDQYKNESKAAVMQFAEKHLTGKDCRYTVNVEEGKPAEEILSSAEKCGANLIVMASSKHSGLNKLFVGSVAAKVLGRSSIPVMVVKP